MRSTAIRGAALLIAALLVFAVSIQNVDVTGVAGPVDARLFRIYTPYFPGLSSLDQHEIFSPRYTQKRKILVLGGSAVESIGVDYTWSHEIPGQERNVSSWASVSGQLNEILHEHGKDNWEVFNLARNGAKLTPMLYVYARTLPVKPDLVIMGEAFDTFHLDNADADALNGEQYSSMDRVFGAYPETATLWKAYKSTLAAHGWHPTPAVPPGEPYSVTPKWQAHTPLIDLAALGMERLQRSHFVPPLLYPVRYSHYRDWVQNPSVTRDPDPTFGYFQGFALVADLQKRLGGKMFFFFTPQWDQKDDRAYIHGLDSIYGRYLSQHGIPYANYVPTGLRPIFETYDGVHSTVYGNRRIAGMIYLDLVARGLLD